VIEEREGAVKGMIGERKPLFVGKPLFVVVVVVLLVVALEEALEGLAPAVVVEIEPGVVLGMLLALGESRALIGVVLVGVVVAMLMEKIEGL